MKLVIKQILPAEICHYASPELLITSTWNRITVRTSSGELTFKLPSDGWKSFFGLTRLTRRALRLDKCNVVPAADGYVCIRQGRVYRYDEASSTLIETLKLKNCRNVLHQSIAVIDGIELFFGEYGNNGERAEVPVYHSRDGGRSWQVAHTFPAGSIKHIHGCYYDPVEKKIWVLTGDFEDECRILCADRDFKNLEWIGDGQQTFRTCNVFFEQDSVHWIMDSQLQDSYHIRLDRKTRKVERKSLFPGPVWYIKRLKDGYYLAATAQEIGPGVKDGFAHLMASRDLETWQDLKRFEHDGLPKRWFKFGVIGFADGAQSGDHFYLFGEAIRGLDGRVALCAIEGNQS